MRESAKMMAVLELAKAGDRRAREEICVHVWNKYGGKVKRLYSGDVCEDADDLKSVFWEAVVRALAKVDERGDPIYHLGMRGYWKVGGHVRESKKRTIERSLDAPFLSRQVGEDSNDTWAMQLRDERVDVEGIVVNQLGTLQQVSLIVGIGLAPTARRALEAILNDEAGDPTELGFNKRLASSLGVSPQRASQAMQSLRSAVEGEGITE